LALKLARTAHLKNLSRTALQFILQHTVSEVELRTTKNKGSGSHKEIRNLEQKTKF